MPAKIIQMADIPRTISGEIVELAVRSVTPDKPVKTPTRWPIPEALDLSRNLSALKT